MILIVSSLTSYGYGFYRAKLIGNEKPCPADTKRYSVELYWVENNFESLMGITDVTSWSFSGAQRISGGTNGDPYIDLKINNDTLVTISCTVKKDAVGNYPSFNGTVSLRIHPYCVKGLSPASVIGNAYVNKLDISPQTYSISTLKYLNGDNVSSYGWVIPSGWSYNGSISNGSSPFIINSTSITVIPNDCSGGNISVYGISKCGVSTSNLSTIPVSRPFNNCSISGSSPVCNSNSTFTINNLPPFNSIVWTPGPNLSISSGQNTDSCTFYTNASGNSSISAKVYTACGVINVPAINVCLGAPVINASEIVFSNSAGGQGYLCTSQAGNTFELTSCNSNYYEIKLTYLDETTIVSQYNTTDGFGSLDYSQLSPDYYLFWARGINNCGTGEWCVTEVEYVDCSLFRLLVSPNPANSEATIELTSNTESEEVAKTPEWELVVYGTNQELKTKSQKIKNKTHKINTQGWKDGVYIIRAKVDGKPITGKLIIKH